MHKILFHIGSSTIYTYGVMLSLGFAAGMLAAWKLSSLRGLDKDHLLNSFILLLFGAIAGSRILFVLINFSFFLKNPLKIIRIDEGGLVFLGGFFGAFGVTWLYYRLKNLNYLCYGDILMPAVALGHAFGRVGCYFNGCCYGRAASLGEWGVMFPGMNVLRVPVQLYSSLGNFVIFLILVFMLKKIKTPGIVMAMYMLLYPTHRFFMEFLRADNRGAFYAGLSISQWISIFIFISGLIFLKIIQGSAKKDS
jgi:phosphatidylglycerol:prolipoprotein diacylglycerol transferase